MGIEKTKIEAKIMKRTLRLLIALVIYSTTSFSQVFEPQIIIDDLVGSNGVIYHDFNEDGIPEYIVARYSQDVVTMLYWDGTQFVEKDLITIDEPNDMVLGDFNQDGMIDIAITASNISGIRILRNMGDLDFSVQTIRVFDYDDAGAIAAADLDLDGDLDLVVSSYKRDDIAVFEMTNPGFFSFNVKIIDSGRDSRDVSIADLDKDGLPDIISTGSGNVYIYFNEGGNNFQRSTYAFSGVQQNCIADFNNDGYLDIGTSSFIRGELSVFLNNGDRTFEGTLIDASVNDASDLSCFDIDKDNIPDIVVSTGEGIIVFLIKDINNNEHIREDYFYDGWIGPFDVADIDGDGDLDLIATSTAIPGIIHYINTTLTSSLFEVEDLSINIYPNPAKDFIFIDGISTYNLKLFDLQGKLIKSTWASNQLQLNSAPAGTYLLEVIDLKSGQKAIEKIVIGR